MTGIERACLCINFGRCRFGNEPFSGIGIYPSRNCEQSFAPHTEAGMIGAPFGDAGRQNSHQDSRLGSRARGNVLAGRTRVGVGSGLGPVLGPARLERRRSRRRKRRSDRHGSSATRLGSRSFPVQAVAGDLPRRKRHHAALDAVAGRALVSRLLRAAAEHHARAACRRRHPLGPDAGGDRSGRTSSSRSAGSPRPSPSRWWCRSSSASPWASPRWRSASSTSGSSVF